MAGGDEHRLLQAVRQSSAQDKDAREALYRRIIDAMDMGESNYLILLAADTYDVPYKGRGDETLPTALTRCSSTFCAASAL